MSETERCVELIRNVVRLPTRRWQTLLHMQAFNVPYLSCEGMGTEIMTEKIGISIKANPVTRNIMLKSRIT